MEALSEVGLNGQQHHPTQQQQELVVNLSDMADISVTQQEEIVSIPKEVILISLVSQEQALYNPKHENYRNAQRKDAKWVEIAESIGWPEAQCKGKWKAMRDQYCRELKRSKFNAKANVKWKYFKELDFLRPYALSRNYRPRNSLSSSATTPSTNNSFNTNSSNNNNNNSSGGSNNNSLTDTSNKFPNIKIEAAPFNPCEFTTTTTNTIAAAAAAPQIKSESARQLITSITDDQLSNVIQQDSNWNYLTATNASGGGATAHRDNNTHDNNNLLQHNHHQQQQQQQQHTTTTADDVFYSAFVDCVTAAAAGQMHQQQQQQQQHPHLMQQQTHQQPDEEDDDPIHTFLNIESYFEKELIAMIQQEDILYNSFHTNYRNVKLKLEVWEEISRKLKKTVKQCRLKWKALRDQYIREHKRLKNRENAETLPRWKHYDALNFLQKFIKHKTNDFEAKNFLQMPKTEMDTEMDEHIISSNSPTLRSSPLDAAVVPHELQQQQQQQQLQTLPSLTGPHAAAQQQLQQALQQQQQQQQQQQSQHLHQQNTHDTGICVVGGGGGGTGSVSGYDEMDIDNYIIGDAASDDPHDDVDGDEEEDEDRKSQQHFPDYANASNDDNDSEEDEREFKMTISRESTPLPQQSQSHQSQLQPQQEQHHQQQQQQHQEHIMSVDLGDATTLAADESLHNNNNHHHQNFTANPLNAQTTTTSTPLLNGIIHSSLNVANDTPTSAMNMAAVATNGMAAVPVAITSSTSVGDDDEVGAFFKAVAMKIRSAKMSPVAFTDLQIDILRVINDSLRNTDQ